MIGVQWIGSTCVYTKADLYLDFLPFITRTRFQWTRILKNHRPQLTTHPRKKKIPVGNLTNTYLKQLCLKGNTLSNPLAPHLGHCQSNLSHHFWGIDSSNFVGVPVCSPKLGSVNVIYLQLSKMKAKQVIKAIDIHSRWFFSARNIRPFMNGEFIYMGKISNFKTNWNWLKHQKNLRKKTAARIGVQPTKCLCLSQVFFANQTKALMHQRRCFPGRRPPGKQVGLWDPMKLWYLYII